jgi:polar amino acid transport system ATP-binding protein
VTRIRTNLSMVFQQFNLWSHMTVLQNVMEAPVTVLKRDRKRSRRRPATIWPRSASAKRPTPGPRSCRAASSSAPPSPAPVHGTPGPAVRRTDQALDPELEQEVVRVIKALADEGRTMLLVTHDMKLAADVQRPRHLPAQGPDRGTGPPRQPCSAIREKRPPARLSVGDGGLMTCAGTIAGMMTGLVLASSQPVVIGTEAPFPAYT